MSALTTKDYWDQGYSTVKEIVELNFGWRDHVKRNNLAEKEETCRGLTWLGVFPNIIRFHINCHNPDDVLHFLTHQIFQIYSALSIHKIDHQT